MNPSLLGVLAVAAALGLTLALSSHDPDVTTARYVKGILIAVFAVGSLPALAYYAAGRALHRHPVILGVMFVVSLAALYVYLFIGVITVADYVYCTEDAYECPL